MAKKKGFNVKPQGGIKTSQAKIPLGAQIPMPVLNAKRNLLGQGGAASRGSY